MSWYQAIEARQSLGRQTRRPGSLAGLHEARREHLGQFFTPTPLAALLWRVVSPAIERALARRPGARVAVLDNSVGTGRLLQFADPKRHVLGGVDIHAESVAALVKEVEAAGFQAEIVACGMEAAKPSGYGVAVINPPFSLHLESPMLEPYPCTTWGRFGANTSATSHAYALHQALEAADVVAAILPRTYASLLPADPDLSGRLWALIELPTGAFREEGTDVRVDIAVFGREERDNVQRITVASFSDPVPDLGLQCVSTWESRPRLSVTGIKDEGPSITTAVTGDNRVRVVHDRRRIGLRFACGLTEARVLNALYRDLLDNHRLDNHRYPSGIRYLGEAVLDLEVHLVQPDPWASFQDLIDTIRNAGGAPEVDPGLINYLRKRMRQIPRQTEPFAQTVYMPDGMLHDGPAKARARTTFVANPNVWLSPVIEQGTEVELEPTDDGRFAFSVGGECYVLGRDEVYDKFDVPQAEGRWVKLFPGRHVRFPELAHALRARVRALGIDAWMNWPHQADDLIEVMIAPGGATVGWDTGLGKARLAAALILLSGCRHGLITVFPYLLDEMVTELSGLPIDQGDWQVIERPEQLQNLKRINVITYNRLRAPIHEAHPRRTYAKLLRRRIGTLVADEGELLANMQSQQARALWQLSARRRFVLTATPIANYPRDTLPLRVFTAGDAVAHQPYGYRRYYLDPVLRQSTMTAARGIDAFRDHFVTVEWVTHEWEEDMQSGAKREVPKITNLEEYRRKLRPHLKRRVVDEPEIAARVPIPKPAESYTEVEWDEDHLAYYLDVAEHFAQWYLRARQDAAGKNRQINLVALLARIQAVQFAASFPQRGIEGFGAYMPLTSKQRYAIDRMKRWADEGRKAILYADNPGLLDLLHRHLQADGYDALVFHGGQPIKARTRALKSRFRFGDTPNLLASIRVTQAGLNIPEASRVLFYNRGWTWKTEKQAQGRVLRPQQKNDVLIDRAHLVGSIDVYMGQMVAFKRDAFQAGLDFATPEFANAEFAHLDTVLYRFCEDLAKLRQMSARELVDHLTARRAAA